MNLKLCWLHYPIDIFTMLVIIIIANICDLLALCHVKSCTYSEKTKLLFRL